MKTNYPHLTDWNEAKIVDALLDAVAAKSPPVDGGDGGLLRIRVEQEDGDFGPPLDPADPAEICMLRQEIGQTGITILRVVRKSAKARHVGAIALVHGNGEDLISDYSWAPNLPRLEKVMTDIVDAASKTCGIGEYET